MDGMDDMRVSAVSAPSETQERERERERDMGRGNMKTWRHGHGLEVETGNRKVLPFFFLSGRWRCVCVLQWDFFHSRKTLSRSKVVK